MCIRDSKKNLSRTDDRSTNIPNLGWVGPPTPRTVGAMGTPREKWKFSYISFPAAHADYSATNVIPPVAVVAAVKRLPCHISQFAPTFHRGQKSAAPLVQIWDLGNY